MERCFLKASKLGALACFGVTQLFQREGAEKKKVLPVVISLEWGSKSWFLVPTFGSLQYLGVLLCVALGNVLGGKITWLFKILYTMDILALLRLVSNKSHCKSSIKPDIENSLYLSYKYK